MSRPLLSAIATASSRAKQLNDEYISTEHLLVGLAADGGDAEAVLAAPAGATPDALLEAFSQIRGSAGSPARTRRAPTRRWRSSAST